MIALAGALGLLHLPQQRIHLAQTERALAADRCATGHAAKDAMRGTIEVEAAVLYLMQFRDADLNLQFPTTLPYRTDLCQDIPPWWNLKKKKTMFHTGSIDARAAGASEGCARHSSSAIATSAPSRD